MRLAIPPDLDARAIAGVDRAAQVVDLAGETMGTVWRVRCAVSAAFDTDALRGAIVRRLAGLVAEMSHWEPDSRLSRFNRAAAGSWIKLPRDFATVMAAGLSDRRAVGRGVRSGDRAAGRSVGVRPPATCARPHRGGDRRRAGGVGLAATRL